MAIDSRMTIGATSLRNNAQISKVNKNGVSNGAVSFGQDKEDSKKSHKGLFVTIGAVAALAIAGVVFRKKIAANKYVQGVSEKVNEKAPEMKKQFKKAARKANNIITNAKAKIKSMFNTKTAEVVAEAKAPAVVKEAEAVIVSKFSEAEQAIIKKYKMSSNKQPILEVLKNYGMDEPTENLIKTTFEEIAKKGKNPLKFSEFVNMHLKGNDSPNEIVNKMVENAFKIRKANKI